MVSPTPVNSARWPVAVSATLGGLGILEVLSVYLAVRSHLPASVVWH
ncbi:MAG: hypothetical protein L3K02_09105 [Thermoplasmata archaeon]|nr:hypothetical protein [Thermoplasmata archaeon]